MVIVKGHFNFQFLITPFIRDAKLLNTCFTLSATAMAGSAHFCRGVSCQMVVMMMRLAAGFLGLVNVKGF